MYIAVLFAKAKKNGNNCPLLINSKMGKCAIEMTSE